MRICEYCGKEYEGRGKRYCSQSCANKHRRILEREQYQEYTVWSCGGGVDSTALAVLFYTGQLPTPDYAVMVDTGYEKSAVTEYVETWTKPKLREVGIKLETIKTKDWNPKQAIIDSNGFCAIPAFQKVEGERRGVRMRTCCNETWKVQVIRKWLRANGVQRYTSIIGISADEAHRQRKTSRAMCTNNYPLVDMGITRSDCIHIINQAGWPVPPRSSCIMCGLQSDGEFYKLQYRSPHDWKRLIEIEHEIHRTRPDVFIHKTCRPIEEVFV